MIDVSQYSNLKSKNLVRITNLNGVLVFTQKTFDPVFGTGINQNTPLTLADAQQARTQIAAQLAALDLFITDLTAASLAPPVSVLPVL